MPRLAALLLMAGLALAPTLCPLPQPPVITVWRRRGSYPVPR